MNECRCRAASSRNGHAAVDDSRLDTLVTCKAHDRTPYAITTTSVPLEINLVDAKA